jgi:hypothetical protein
VRFFWVYFIIFLFSCNEQGNTTKVHKKEIVEEQENILVITNGFIPFDWTEQFQSLSDTALIRIEINHFFKALAIDQSNDEDFKLHHFIDSEIGVIREPAIQKWSGNLDEDKEDELVWMLGDKEEWTQLIVFLDRQEQGYKIVWYEGLGSHYAWPWFKVHQASDKTTFVEVFDGGGATGFNDYYHNLYQYKNDAFLRVFESSNHLDMNHTLQLKTSSSIQGFELKGNLELNVKYNYEFWTCAPFNIDYGQVSWEAYGGASCTEEDRIVLLNDSSSYNFIWNDDSLKFISSSTHGSNVNNQLNVLHEVYPYQGYGKRFFQAFQSELEEVSLISEFVEVRETIEWMKVHFK